MKIEYELRVYKISTLQMGTAHYEEAFYRNSKMNYAMKPTMANEKKKAQKDIGGRNRQEHNMFGNIRLQNSM